jgi:serine/threonine-protein kinase
VTAAARHKSTSLAPGYKLDRYELLCPIAEGGMASVWVARQRGKHGFEKLVAIKTILPKFASDVRFQEMFLDEAKIASRIEHLNVAQIFDLGEEHDVLYLAMEYVDGDSLSKLNRACQKQGVKIPTGVVLRVLADTCAGLHEAHEMKDGAGSPLEIVHRDVSPHNILVSTRGIAKLIDFGIATARSRAGGETSSGVLKGKIQYMAPEQALSQPVDRRGDIWAVGAILYHLLAGKPPYEGDNQLATLHLLGSGRPPVPLGPNVHGAIAAIARKALSFTAANRYSTAAEMRDALEHAMVEARLQTTTAEVAAFAAKHLGDRVEKRRNAIEAALAAADERQRADDASGDPLPLVGVRMAPHGVVRSASTSRPSLASADANTVTDSAATDKSSLAAIAKMTARLSEPPPPQTSSYATIGSAALDTPVPMPSKSRRGLVATLGVLLVMAAVAGGYWFNPLRAKLPVPPVGVAASTVNGPTPPTTANPSSPGPPGHDSPSSVPIVAATSLPLVNQLSTEPPYSPRARPLAPPPQKSVGPKRKPAMGQGGANQTDTAPSSPATTAQPAAPPATPVPGIDDGF